MKNLRDDQRGPARVQLRIALLAIVSLGCMGASRADEGGIRRLTDMSLEDLGNIEVTSVSKRAQPLSNAPASVFVITADDIRRSGVTSLPEALRLAPNLQVSRESASGYVIAARGFNAPNSNKLLVLIDGRSVYTPLFSGVFWEVQDVMLEDVQRIEVISGPGGTLWGVNAVNGVINVITQSASRTQGQLLAAGAGDREAELAARHGAPAGEDGHYRVYAKHIDRRHTDLPDGTPRDDAWHKSQVGFRADWRRSGDEFTAQGNLYHGSIGQPEPGTFFTGTPLALENVSVSGVNLLARWTRPLAGSDRLSVQAYFDRTERVIPPTLAEELDIVDLQFQHAWHPTPAHAVAWGMAYRYSADRVKNSEFIAFLPARVHQRWPSLFAQDEVSLNPALRLTFGARIDRNDYTGTEVLPNARLAWQVAPDQFLWSALSRTVRAPSRLDRDIFSPGEPPFLLGGGPSVRSEIANVFEVGYRGRPTSRLSYAVTAFRADYDHLRTLEFAPPGSGAVVAYANQMEGKTSGVEMWGTYAASDTLRLSAGYALLDKDLQLKPGSADLDAALASEGSDPRHRWTLRASLDLPGSGELDATARHVSALSSPAVESYTTLDVRYAWRPHPAVEMSVSGRNLLGGHTEYEFIPPFRSEFEPSVFFKVVGRF